MRLAIISDIHGNLPMLEACLAEIATRQCDRIVCLGDVFGYFPDGLACAQRLRDVHADCLMGNHEAMLLGLLPLPEVKDEVYRLGAQRELVPASLLQHMQGWLPYASEVIGTKRVLMVHGSPWQPLTEYVYPNSDLSRFAALPFDAVFMGHTHHAFVRNSGDVQVCNTGSCGLPRDVGRPSFAVFDVTEGTIEVVRLSVDRTQLQQHYPNLHPSIYSVWSRGHQTDKE
ncbi:metallophosphoesterase family protein [Trinickia mobilis]|uniref:metallophosphoesterase family protein n=1 Tax=Trinickia mobilis TaxID=2816356 RepID=UPI001A8FC9F1|nr:metallophosphoesterase family protein [Trinickia mobilis]